MRRTTTLRSLHYSLSLALDSLFALALCALGTSGAYHRIFIAFSVWLNSHKNYACPWSCPAVTTLNCINCILVLEKLTINCYMNTQVRDLNLEWHWYNSSTEMRHPARIISYSRALHDPVAT